LPPIREKSEKTKEKAMTEITKIVAREIIDSRANPTVEAEVWLSDGTVGLASVPSGASTGQNEALELRDGEMGRYGGRGVLAAVKAVNDIIAPALVGMPAHDLTRADSVMIALDGSRNKSNLGANATLSVSMALLRAAAHSYRMPIYRFVGGAYRSRLPVPMMNILNGGAHASNNVEIQEFMIIPRGAPSFSEGIRMGVEIYHSLKRILNGRGYSVGVGDEGGFAPSLDTDEEAIELILEAIEAAGYKAGSDVALGLDVAASEWYEGGEYHLHKRGEKMTTDELIAYIEALVKKYPIISVEDGVGELDGYGWQKITSRLGGITLVGDDFFVTDAVRIINGAKEGMANAVLIKPNQIGTVSEAAEAISTARRYGYKTVMSHRSGETEDSTIADLAVGFGTELIKTGAPSRAERTAKYNRLLRIEEELFSAEYGF